MIDKIERYSKNIGSYEDFIADEKNIDMMIPPLTQNRTDAVYYHSQYSKTQTDSQRT
jgi:hypothetical protein